MVDPEGKKLYRNGPWDPAGKLARAMATEPADAVSIRWADGVGQQLSSALSA
jgi:hypothetical protein